METMDVTPAAEHRAPQPASIHPQFRNGSLTAVSVLAGFSLSFLSRWAGTPGEWHAADLMAVTLIVIGSGLQIWALSSMLFASSQPLPFDTEGRIVLPESLAVYAHISDSAAFVGLGKSFQIWQPDRFADHQAMLRERARRQGTSLPPLGGSLGRRRE